MSTKDTRLWIFLFMLQFGFYNTVRAYLIGAPFCALLWRWALKNVGTCFCKPWRSKSLVSATFFTERERPTETMMLKKVRSTQLEQYCKSAVTYCYFFFFAFLA